MGNIILIALVLMLFWGLAAWPYSRTGGNYPSGVFGILLLVLIFALLSCRV